MKPERFFVCNIDVFSGSIEVRSHFLFRVSGLHNPKDVFKAFESNYYGGAKYSRTQRCYVVEGADIQYSGIEWKEIDENDFLTMQPHLPVHVAN
jgi:hypothetical protein